MSRINGGYVLLSAIFPSSVRSRRCVTGEPLLFKINSLCLIVTKTDIDMDCLLSGWGTHAYFQMLADSRNDVQNSAGMNHLSVRQTELENVYVDREETSMEISRSNTRDTTRMLENR